MTRTDLWMIGQSKPAREALRNARLIGAAIKWLANEGDGSGTMNNEKQGD